VQLYDNGVGFYIPNKTEIGKTGFGLRYIMNRVELHKGRIKVNKLEKGTSLSIELPLPEG
jgi:signal transduction histidine kinase